MMIYKLHLKLALEMKMQKLDLLNKKDPNANSWGMRLKRKMIEKSKIGKNN